MREILFRGKRIDNSEWVYGNYAHTDIYTEVNEFAIVPETVGQYTGIKDRNGVKIFEGDIIQRKGYIYPLGKIEPCGERIVRGVVVWKQPEHEPGYWAIDSEDEHGNPTGYIFEDTFDIIGNIYDNPEVEK